MSNWFVTAPGLEHYSVRIGDCDRKHAESVLASLLQDPKHPNLLGIVEATDDWQPLDEVLRLQGEETGTPSWLQRMFGRKG